MSGCRDRRSAGLDAAVAAETLHDPVAPSTPDAWRDELRLGVGRPGFILAQQGVRGAVVSRDRVERLAEQRRLPDGIRHLALAK